MDITELPDTDLDDLRRQIISEQERRSVLESIPTTVAELAQRFKAGGGSQEALEAAIAPVITADDV